MRRPSTPPRLQLSLPVRPPSAMELAQNESRAAMRAAGEVATAATSRSCGLPGEPRQGSTDGGRYGATRARDAVGGRGRVESVLKSIFLNHLRVERAGQRGETANATQTHRTKDVCYEKDGSGSIDMRKRASRT